MRIAYLAFPDITPLDLVGPYEVLSRLPGEEHVIVGKERGPVASNPAGLALVVEATLDEIDTADIILIPGGIGTRPLIEDEETLDWIRRLDKVTTWTTSVCTGALLLAAAGLLNDRPATTHWAAYDKLAELGARPTEQRVVVDDKYITAAGVSSGIDMALELVRLLEDDELAKAIQLYIEYDPQPPFDSGSPSKATPETFEAIGRLRS
jgi:putative intracellular protease/amidase